MDQHVSAANIHTLTTSDRFESDTQKIVRKHLEDKNHVISEDEIRNIRVGMTPSPEQNPAGEDAVQENHELPGNPLAQEDGFQN